MEEIRNINDFKIWAGSLVADPLQGQEIGISGKMSNDTQPLEPGQVPSIEESRDEWWNREASIHGISPIEVAEQQLKQDEKLSDEDFQRIQRVYQKIREEQKMRKQQPDHVHGPFTFLLNQNHNALRGCQSCGATWVGVMAGTEDDIRWHEVQEPPELEEE